MLKTINGEAAREILESTPSDPPTLAKKLASCHVADAIEVLNTFDAKQAARIIEHMPEAAGIHAFNNAGLIWPWKIIEQ